MDKHKQNVTHLMGLKGEKRKAIAQVNWDDFDIRVFENFGGAGTTHTVQIAKRCADDHEQFDVIERHMDWEELQVLTALFRKVQGHLDSLVVMGD